VKDQLEALILQMYKSNILYSEGMREFKKRFILTVLQENKGNQCRVPASWQCTGNTSARTIDELKIDVRQLRMARNDRLAARGRRRWRRKQRASLKLPLFLFVFPWPQKAEAARGGCLTHE